MSKGSSPRPLSIPKVEFDSRFDAIFKRQVPVAPPPVAEGPLADPGFKLCPTCDGTGQGMDMVCYGGPVYEVEVDCPDCDGNGQVKT